MRTDASHPSSPIDPQTLPADAEALRQLAQQLLAREAQLAAELAQASRTVAEQQQQLEKLAHEMAQLKRMLFGSRRERFATDDPRQKTLFEVSDEGAKLFEGVLQADAFSGYDEIFYGSKGKIVETGCSAHARRKFFDAKETSPELAHHGLAVFQRLYAIISTRKLICATCWPGCRRSRIRWSCERCSSTAGRRRTPSTSKCIVARNRPPPPTGA